MILVIDNYDSFTYNLVQYVGELGLNGVGIAKEVVVYRNDKIDIPKIESLSPDCVIISPGPGTPLDAGVSNDVIKRFKGRFPILGVCLGHQCIAYVFGAEIVGAKRLMHGKTSWIFHDGKGIYRGIKNPFVATRYHSLIVKRDSIPNELVVSAWTEDDEVMGIRHKYLPLDGVQYHPESILTKEGKRILRNFLEAAHQNIKAHHEERG